MSASARLSILPVLWLLDCFLMKSPILMRTSGHALLLLRIIAKKPDVVVSHFIFMSQTLIPHINKDPFYDSCELTQSHFKCALQFQIERVDQNPRCRLLGSKPPQSQLLHEMEALLSKLVHLPVQRLPTVLGSRRCSAEIGQS